jgi:hypothetical protein
MFESYSDQPQQQETDPRRAHFTPKNLAAQGHNLIVFVNEHIPDAPGGMPRADGKAPDAIMVDVVDLDLPSDDNTHWGLVEHNYWWRAGSIIGKLRPFIGRGPIVIRLSGGQAPNPFTVTNVMGDPTVSQKAHTWGQWNPNFTRTAPQQASRQGGPQELQAGYSAGSSGPYPTTAQGPGGFVPGPTPNMPTQSHGSPSSYPQFGNGAPLPAMTHQGGQTSTLGQTPIANPPPTSPGRPVQSGLPGHLSSEPNAGWHPVPSTAPHREVAGGFATPASPAGGQAQGWDPTLSASPLPSGSGTGPGTGFGSPPLPGPPGVNSPSPQSTLPPPPSVGDVTQMFAQQGMTLEPVQVTERLAQQHEHNATLDSLRKTHNIPAPNLAQPAEPPF